MKKFEDYFEIIKFASPETNVRFKNSSVVPKSDEIIIAKCMNWEDVMHLIMADSILTRNNIICRWYIPYKPFARQDRVTALNHANETDVLNQLIHERLNGRVIFLDIHSFVGKSGKTIEQFAPIQYYKPFGKCKTGAFGEWNPGFHLIVPDEGARKKVSPFFNSNEITNCSKKRDPITGKLSGFIVPEIKSKRPLVLVDDICDGGGTFIGIAEQLQKYRKNNELILYVTHGLFTKGADELFKYYDRIFTTNSVFVSNAQNAKIEVLDVLTESFLTYCGI